MRRRTKLQRALRIVAGVYLGSAILCVLALGIFWWRQAEVTGEPRPAKVEQQGFYAIAVDRNGSAVDPTNRALLSEAELQRQFESLSRALRAHSTRRVLLFVHGGLNSLDTSFARAQALAGQISAGGDFPIFVNWNSDFLDSYVEQLIWIRQGRTARVLGPLSSPIVLVADVASAVLRAPIVWGQMIASDLNAFGVWTFPGKENSWILYETFGARCPETERRQGRCLNLSLDGDPAETASLSWSSRVSYVATLPIKLLLSPFIDAFGRTAWDNMRRRAQNLFHHAQAFDVRDIRACPTCLAELFEQEGSGAVSKLMRALQRHHHHSPLEITLMGHSMGAIVANMIVRRFPDLTYTSVVYMAAACSIEDFRSSVIPYLAASDARFYNLTLHPLAEVREGQWSYLDLTPRGSLLIWIDNFLAAPQTTLDRTLGHWENILQATHVIPPHLRGRIHVRAFCPGGSSCDGPLRHGDFTQVAFWDRTFWGRPGAARPPF